MSACPRASFTRLRHHGSRPRWPSSASFLRTASSGLAPLRSHDRFELVQPVGLGKLKPGLRHLRPTSDWLCSGRLGSRCWWWVASVQRRGTRRLRPPDGRVRRIPRHASASAQAPGQSSRPDARTRLSPASGLARYSVSVRYFPHGPLFGGDTPFRGTGAARSGATLLTSGGRLFLTSLILSPLVQAGLRE